MKGYIRGERCLGKFERLTCFREWDSYARTYALYASFADTLRK